MIVNEPAAMLLGFGAVGLGSRSPTRWSSVRRAITRRFAGRAVAGVATVGYGGFLAGPPLLGWLAQPTSLRLVMIVIVVLAALTATLAPAVRIAVTSRQRADR